MLPRHGIVLEFSLIGGDFDSAGEASSKIKRTLQQLGVRPEIIRRIAISAYEAEMNVIIHAYRGVIRAEIFSDRTELCVEDEGPGIRDVDLAMQEGYSTAPDHIREMGFGAGMGLPNMARCTDTLDIQTTPGIGTKLSMIINH
ncbi:ATP-binding protein [Sporomusa acidovorans]|uniref:Anti-sigma F factor n=1 Tax=Sporomusa acidovorans (strain ATCC 49682 / DSM 3132 / Mol) TaxID=1123286 RepID=A0ABZ3J1W7_SPOA4|nr:anti-sigma regulatory factor [Sporomusa acidovorans]OZC22470.1 serine/threonine-protein kinase RsbT [Sporomusa acidovorans DSM 3132]SDE74105.1 Anti-sigma regulatory factor (Ser/Thr protein kinase) [Sporomusa acidovorans]